MKPASVAPILLLLLAMAPPGTSQSKRETTLEVTAGAVRQRVEIRLGNPTQNAAIASVGLELVAHPTWVLSPRVSGAATGALGPGEERSFTVLFDVASTATAGATGELVLAVVAEAGVYPERERVQIPLEVRGEATGPLYVLSEIEVPDRHEHRPGELGYVMRQDNANGTVVLTAISCAHCPARIEPGQSFGVDAVLERRFDWREYPCSPGGSGVMWTGPALDVWGVAAEAAAVGPDLRGPTCEELGIEEWYVNYPGGDGHPGINTVARDPAPPLTLQDHLHLSVSFDFERLEPDSTGDPRFLYRVRPETDGEIYRSDPEGYINISYQDRRRRLEDVIDEQLAIEIGEMTLVYRLQRGDVRGMTPKPFELPAEFERPPLGPSTRVADTGPDFVDRPPAGETMAGREDETVPAAPEPEAPGPGPPSEIPLPTHVEGLPLDEALDRLPPVLDPFVVDGDRPPSPDLAGTVQRVTSGDGGPLHPGDTVIVTAYPEPIPLPDHIVGDPIDDAVSWLDPTLVPRVRVGSRAPTADRGGTVERIVAPDGEPLFPGDTVVIFVHPESIPLPEHVIGLPVDTALSELPPGLVPRVEVGSRARTAAEGGTVEGIASADGGPLYPGDAVVISVHPEPIPLPEELVGLPVDTALSRLPGGLVPRVEEGGPPPTRARAHTVERVASPTGGPLYPGDAVVIYVHPEPSPPPSERRPPTPTPRERRGRSSTTRAQPERDRFDGPGYRLDTIGSGQIRPRRLPFKEPVSVDWDASGGRAVVEIAGSDTCSERVEFTWGFDRDIRFLRVDETFELALETAVRGDCTSRDPFARPGASPSRRASFYDELPEGALSSRSSRHLEMLDDLEERENRVYGKEESGPEFRSFRVQGGRDYLLLGITLHASSGREGFDWQVVYVFRRVEDGPRPAEREAAEPAPSQPAGSRERAPARPGPEPADPVDGIRFPLTVDGPGGVTFRLRTSDNPDLRDDGLLVCEDCSDKRGESFFYDAVSGRHAGFSVRLSWFLPGEGQGFCRPSGRPVYGGMNQFGIASMAFYDDRAATQLIIDGCAQCSYAEDFEDWLPLTTARELAAALLPQIRPLAVPCR